MTSRDYVRHKFELRVADYKCEPAWFLDVIWQFGRPPQISPAVLELRAKTLLLDQTQSGITWLLKPTGEMKSPKWTMNGMT
jgi:hypothetical protein